MKLRFLLTLAATIAVSATVTFATEEPKETFYDKFKKLFVRPTATPKPRRKKQPTATPTPAVAATTAEQQESATPAPTVPMEAQRTEPQGAQPQYFEPVRPINPGPRSRRRPTPRITATPEMTPVSTSTETPAATPTPTPAPTPSPPVTPLPTETPLLRPTPSLPPLIKTSPTPVTKKVVTAPATIALGEIADSESYPSEVRKIVELTLNLTSRNLAYKYVSADPARGGMDSSGFIYYVLSNAGIGGVPRDARDQYIWVRKAGNFQAVLAQRDDTFELDGLKPGDLLFWASNYGISADPDIVQTMIYIGRDKATKQRLMVGASEASSFKGKPHSGVGVFDFKVGRGAPKSNKEPGPVFVGYGHVPGLTR